MYHPAMVYAFNGYQVQGYSVTGKMICIEGVEGAGKSSAISCVKETLSTLGITDIVSTREPGGTPIAEALRELIKFGLKDETPTTTSETLMLYAARSQLLTHVIKPALRKGQWVVSDRHNLSTYAYQGAGRGVNMDFLTTLADFCLKDFKPALTLYLDLPPDVGLKRIQKRQAIDRIEKEDIEFFERIRQAYLSFAKNDDTIIVVDASKPIENVHQRIREMLSEWFANNSE